MSPPFMSFSNLASGKPIRGFRTVPIPFNPWICSMLTFRLPRFFVTSDTNGGPGGYHPFWISCLVSNIISWNTTLDSAFIYDNIGVFSCKIMNAPRNYIILNKGIHCDIVSAIFT